VSRFSTKYQFNEVQSSQAHLWKPPSFSRQLLVRVENDLLIRSVSWFSAKDHFSEVQSSQAHSRKPLSFFPRQLIVRVVNPPNTECVTIFYKRSVQWGTILTSALSKTTEFFFGSYSCAWYKTSWYGVCHDFLQKISSVRYHPHKRIFENHRMFPRQLLVRVVNDLLIWSVSRFSTKDQFS